MTDQAEYRDPPPRPDRAKAVLSGELEQILSRIKDERERMRTELEAERELTTELREQLEKLRDGDFDLFDDRPAGSASDSSIAAVADLAEQRELRRSGEPSVGVLPEDGRLRSALATAEREIDRLRSELARFRVGKSQKRTTGPDERPSRIYVVDGDGLAALIWPNRPVAQSRVDLATAVEASGARENTAAELVFRNERGLERLSDHHCRTRVWIPPSEVPLDAFVRHLHGRNRRDLPTVVVSGRPGFTDVLSPIAYAEHLGLRRPPERPEVLAR